MDMDVWIRRFMRLMLFFILIGTAVWLAHMFINLPEPVYFDKTITTVTRERQGPDNGPGYVIGAVIALFAAAFVVYWDE